ncbi:MAG: ATP-binding protein [Methanosarcinales archaeon]|nr:ATP-binding protein [Methanosarcinales archaeon]
MIHRKLTHNIANRFFKGKVILLFGARQVGKTTLINQLLENRSEPILSISGDEPDIREIFKEITSTQLKTLIGNHKILFIDEAQRIKNIGLTLKLIIDNIKGVQVIATGSSAFELANKTSEPLTGRKYAFHLHPITFEEMLEHSNLLIEKRNLPQRLVYGCYPEIIIKESESKELLKLLADSYLYKDLLLLESIKKPILLEKIIKALAFQIGNQVSYNEIARLVQADKITVEKYIDLLQKAFVIFTLPAFSRNVRNEIKKSRKIYFYDNGIRNALIGNFNPIESRTDVGALWENFLVSERLKFLTNNNIDKNIYFWRTTQQQEVDFIEESANTLNAYEFKWNINKRPKLSKTFLRAYPNTTFKVINKHNYESFLI